MVFHVSYDALANEWDLQSKNTWPEQFELNNSYVLYSTYE